MQYLPYTFITVSYTHLDVYKRQDYDWQAGTAYGVVIVDFAPKKIAEQISQTNFQPAQ